MIYLRQCMFSKGINPYHLVEESVTWMHICWFTDHCYHHKGMCGSISFRIYVISFRFILRCNVLAYKMTRQSHFFRCCRDSHRLSLLLFAVRYNGQRYKCTQLFAWQRDPFTLWVRWSSEQDSRATIAKFETHSASLPQKVLVICS